MANPGPTLVTLETSSAWVIILAVSMVTLAAALILRRMIGRPGGLASGILACLPLLVPPIAALAFARAPLPEIAVLRPAGAALLDSPEGLIRLLAVADESHNTLTPYAVSSRVGPWLLLVAVLAILVMLGRRILGALMMRALVARSRPLRPQESQVVASLEALCARRGVKRPPELLIMSSGKGALAVGMRRPRILLSGDLLEELDSSEVQAVLAHELAHLESGDITLVQLAGVLRDLLAWNPFAHIAFRRLSLDRELEADRRAASLTGQPLAVASGLLKVAQSMIVRRRAFHPGLAFFRSRRAVSTRVAQLVAMAEGKSSVVPVGRLPYVAAAALAIVLGLQVGAQFGRQDAGALAIVWGAQDIDASSAWAPKAFVKHPKAREGRESSAWNSIGRPPARVSGRPQARVSGRYPRFARGVPVKNTHFDDWIVAMNRWTRRLGVSGLTLRWQARTHWEAVPLISPDAIGPVGIFRMEARLAP